MDGMMRRLSPALLAAVVAAGLVAAPAFAQITPGGATVGPAGGTASTTAPSNSQGTPAGGTGVIGTTTFGRGGNAVSGDTGSAPAPRRHARRARHRARHAARHSVRPATTDTGSAAGLNGSNAPSR